jgi:hypothetical protein
MLLNIFLFALLLFSRSLGWVVHVNRKMLVLTFSKTLKQGVPEQNRDNESHSRSALSHLRR